MVGKTVRGGAGASEGDVSGLGCAYATGGGMASLGELLLRGRDSSCLLPERRSSASALVLGPARRRYLASGLEGKVVRTEGRIEEVRECLEEQVVLLSK